MLSNSLDPLIDFTLALLRLLSRSKLNIFKVEGFTREKGFRFTILVLHSFIKRVTRAKNLSWRNAIRSLVDSRERTIFSKKKSSKNKESTFLRSTRELIGKR